MTLQVRCDYCGHTRHVEPNPDDRALAISVMDHRNKFSGSSQLFMWYQRYGDHTPEEVFPDLVGYDVDAHYERLNERRRAVHGDRVP